MSGHLRGERRTVGGAQRPVVEITGPVLVCDPHRRDHRHARGHLLAGRPQGESMLHALDPVRQAKRDRRRSQRTQHRFAAPQIGGKLSPAVRPQVRVRVVSQDMTLARRPLDDRPRATRISTPRRLLDVAAEQEEGRPYARVAEHVEQLRGGRTGPVVERQREHRSTILAAVKKLCLVQLPVPPPAALAATGNVPLAAGCLGVAVRVHGLEKRLQVEVIEPAATDALGDTLLADRIARQEPDLVGFSLYLWNSERSLHLAREVKRRSPRTRVLIGGPEVGPDNAFILEQGGADVAVTGEAEDTFARVTSALLEERSPAGIPGVAQRGPLGFTAFAPQPAANFPLTDYPSPYLANLVPVDPRRSTYVGSGRGCRSHCTFCFYPRSPSVRRLLDVEKSAALIAALRDRGAREVVFLDPTFNHRPEFDPLLDALIRENAARALTFFAEIRAEGLTAQQARKLKKAGFDRLEIGLQSVNRETLKRVKRGGSPEKVAEAARMLHGEGIELLVDLIVGLPGDTPEDVLRGIEFLEANGLAGEAQVFPLSLLPGTAMRATAGQDGVAFDPAPPYRVRRTAVVLRGPQPPDWIEAARERAQVFREQSAGEALREPEELGASLPGARITGPVTTEDFSALARLADGDSVVFADEAVELQWTRRVLGFGDAR